MNVGHYCNRSVVIVSGEETATAAAVLMRRYHVGTVVVVEERDEQSHPVGVVTDRDLVIEIMATELDPDAMTVGDLITDPPVLAREDDSLFDTLEVMQRKGVRRVPVVSGSGVLVGIITADDVLGLLAEMLDDLAAMVERQRDLEFRRRPSYPATD